jgi:hypothetical protein
MLITTRKFNLQPENYREAMALRDAFDVAIDHDDTAATRELNTVRETLGPIGTWRELSASPAYMPVEISPAALQLMSLGLELLAEWSDEPDYSPSAHSLTSTELRSLKGLADAWLVTA